jgi:hypothetical protein
VAQLRQGKTTRRWQAYDALLGCLGPTHVRLDRPDRKRLWWEDLGGQLRIGDHSIADLVYGGELLAAVPPGSIVVVTEGEPAADAVRAAGFTALGFVCGASGTPGDAVIGLLRDFDVVLWPDADEVGFKLMSKVAERAERLGFSSLRLVEPPLGVPKGWDAADADPRLIAELISAARSLPMLPPPQNDGDARHE